MHFNKFWSSVAYQIAEENLPAQPQLGDSASNQTS